MRICSGEIFKVAEVVPSAGRISASLTFPYLKRETYLHVHDRLAFGPILLSALFALSSAQRDAWSNA